MLDEVSFYLCNYLTPLFVEQSFTAIDQVYYRLFYILLLGCCKSKQVQVGTHIAPVSAIYCISTVKI